MPLSRSLSSESSETSGVWSASEHERFLEAMMRYPRGPWKRITEHVGSRSIKQVQTHAQKYQQKLLRHQRGLRKIKTKVVRPEHRVDKTTLPQFTKGCIVRQSYHERYSLSSLGSSDSLRTMDVPTSPPTSHSPVSPPASPSPPSFTSTIKMTVNTADPSAPPLYFMDPVKYEHGPMSCSSTSSSSSDDDSVDEYTSPHNTVLNPHSLHHQLHLAIASVEPVPFKANADGYETHSLAWNDLDALAMRETLEVLLI